MTVTTPMRPLLTKSSTGRTNFRKYAPPRQAPLQPFQGEAQAISNRKLEPVERRQRKKDQNHREQDEGRFARVEVGSDGHPRADQNERNLKREMEQISGVADVPEKLQPPRRGTPLPLMQRQGQD